MSQAHSDKFSEMEENVHKWFDKISIKGGKCPMDIQTKFHKMEENVPRSF